VDDRVQQREVWPDTAKVEEYAALYRDGRDLGRLVFFHDAAAGKLILADGFHRRSAALEAGRTTIPAVIYDGTLRDAILYATSCNLHGMSLTKADKRKRVMTLLQDPEWQHWSNNNIAKHCGVSHTLVNHLRDELSLETVSSEDDDEPMPTTRTYTDRYGQVRIMDTSRIGRHAPEAPTAIATPPPCGGPCTEDAGAQPARAARLGPTMIIEQYRRVLAFYAHELAVALSKPRHATSAVLLEVLADLPATFEMEAVLSECQKRMVHSQQWELTRDTCAAVLHTLTEMGLTEVLGRQGRRREYHLTAFGAAVARWIQPESLPAPRRGRRPAGISGAL
jgi:hypothetical protein